MNTIDVTSSRSLYYEIKKADNSTGYVCYPNGNTKQSWLDGPAKESFERTKDLPED